MRGGDPPGPWSLRSRDLWPWAAASKAGSVGLLAPAGRWLAMAKKVLVLGGNFGGLTAALSVKHELQGDIDVTVISASDRFLFNPSLIWLPFGKRRPQDITFPLAPTFESHQVDFVHAGAGWRRFLDDPGPVVVGATQEAGCFGAAYEFLFNLSYQLKKAGLRKRVPLTYVLAEDALEDRRRHQHGDQHPVPPHPRRRGRSPGVGPYRPDGGARHAPSVADPAAGRSRR